MTMPPREALVPLLKLAGTAAVMAVAYSFGSKAVMAAAYKQHGRPSHAEPAKKNKKSDAELSEQKESEETAAAAAATAADTASAPPATIPRSSLAVAMLLQDGYLVCRLHSSSPSLYTS